MENEIKATSGSGFLMTAIQSKFYLLPWIWGFLGISRGCVKKKSLLKSTGDSWNITLKLTVKREASMPTLQNIPNEKSHQSTSRKKYIRYWWIFVDTFIKRSFKTDGDMGGLWNSLTVVRMSKLSINRYQPTWRRHLPHINVLKCQFPKAKVCNTLMWWGSAFRNIV